MIIDCEKQKKKHLVVVGATYEMLYSMLDML